jgi:hypothetical protein
MTMFSGPTYWNGSTSASGKRISRLPFPNGICTCAVWMNRLVCGLRKLRDSVCIRGPDHARQRIVYDSALYVRPQSRIDRAWREGDRVGGVARYRCQISVFRFAAGALRTVQGVLLFFYFPLNNAATGRNWTLSMVRYSSPR